MAERKKLQRERKYKGGGEQGVLEPARTLYWQFIFTPCDYFGYAGHPRSTFSTSTLQKTHWLTWHLQDLWQFSLPAKILFQLKIWIKQLLSRDTVSLPCPCLFPVQAREKSHAGSPRLSIVRHLPQILARLTAAESLFPT